MNARDKKIVEAAFKLFAHYGVSKTSMSEIAAASGVARQTVYNAFEGKEDLIFAAMMDYGCRARIAVEQECVTLTDPADRLDVLLKYLAADPYEAMHSLPHLDEIMEVTEKLPEDRRTQIFGNYRDTIEMALTPFEAQFRKRGIDLKELAGFLKGTFTQIKRDATDRAHLEQLFQPARAMIIACAQG